jgi:hypothetical protein
MGNNGERLPGMDGGIYLILEFDWPNPFQNEHGEMAKALHQVVEEKDWIEETVAASGGVGGGPSSLWIFKLADYAALDRLFHDQEDPVSKGYTAFFSAMVNVQDKIRTEVIFT